MILACRLMLALKAPDMAGVKGAGPGLGAAAIGGAAHVPDGADGNVAADQHIAAVRRIVMQRVFAENTGVAKDFF